MSIVVVNTPESSSTISGITDKHVQQAAVDVSLENVWEMSGLFEIDETSKRHRSTSPVLPDADGYYNLAPGSYEISFDHNIAMGPDEAALMIIRSTLARNGVTLASGVWDPGFSGRGGCCMHVNGGPIRIKKGTRVAQYLVWKVANAQGQYQGDYGIGADGKPKAMEAKYHN